MVKNNSFIHILIIFGHMKQMRKIYQYFLWSILALLTVGCTSSDTTATIIGQIRQKGYIVVGTPGDYRPMTFREADGSYWGFDIDMAQNIAREMGVEVKYVPTTWPTLAQDVMTDGYMDMAVGGITITDARKQEMLMSEGYLHNGKTILCRTSDKDRYTSLDDVNQSDVVVMVNPGGQNEKFARQHLTQVKEILVHERNEEIPSLIAEGKADIMITEILEAPYYVKNDPRLSAPLLSQPFTDGEVGILMPKGYEELLQKINAYIQRIKGNGTLRQLHDKYGFIYRYQ